MKAVYICVRHTTPTPLGYTCEPCSPWELSSVASSAIILNRQTAQALSSFFSHAGLEGWELENLKWLEDDDSFPGIKLGDIVYFIFQPMKNTFQFWKGVKNFA